MISDDSPNPSPKGASSSSTGKRKKGIVKKRTLPEAFLEEQIPENLFDDESNKTEVPNLFPNRRTRTQNYPESSVPNVSRHITRELSRSISSQSNMNDPVTNTAKVVVNDSGRPTISVSECPPSSKTKCSRKTFDININIDPSSPSRCSGPHTHNSLVVRQKTPSSVRHSALSALVDPNTIRVLLVRHGESWGNVEPKTYEAIPDHMIPLTEKGKDMAKAAGIKCREYIESLQNKNTGSIKMWVSPFLRTRETAKYMLGPQTGLAKYVNDISESALLAEQDFGIHEGAGSKGMQNDTYVQNVGIRSQRKRDWGGSFYVRWPTGESCFDVCLRAGQIIPVILAECSKDMIKDAEDEMDDNNFHMGQAPKDAREFGRKNSFASSAHTPTPAQRSFSELKIGENLDSLYVDRKKSISFAGAAEFKVNDEIFEAATSPSKKVKKGVDKDNPFVEGFKKKDQNQNQDTKKSRRSTTQSRRSKVEADCGQQTIIIVSHGVTLRAFQMMWCEYPPEFMDISKNPPNCSIQCVSSTACGLWNSRYIFGGYDKDRNEVDIKTLAPDLNSKLIRQYCKFYSLRREMYEKQHGFSIGGEELAKSYSDCVEVLARQVRLFGKKRQTVTNTSPSTRFLYETFDNSELSMETPSNRGNFTSNQRLSRDSNSTSITSFADNERLSFKCKCVQPFYQMLEFFEEHIPMTRGHVIAATVGAGVAAVVTALMKRR